MKVLLALDFFAALRTIIMIFDHEYMFAIFPHEKSLIVVSGGVGRLYQGLLPALIQAPLSRYLSGFLFKGNICLFSGLETLQEM